MGFQDLMTSLAIIPILVFSLSVHEAAHAWVANLYGDPTAKLEGRQTLNPIAHWDPIGTTLLIGLLLLRIFGLQVPVFGWGKPVPVNEGNFENPRFYGLQTALAGPMSNFLLAIIFALILKFTSASDVLSVVLQLAIYLNIFLMFFNLLPIPPLDGSRLLRLVISDRLYFNLATNPILFFALIFVVIAFFLDYLVMASQFLSILLMRI